MRKNRMMRTASGLLVAVLLTTSVISGTFAKYTTKGSVNDTARVAKFGVAIATSGSLYSDTYYANLVTASNVPAPTTWAVNPDYSNGSGISVNADTANTNIVAPGTESYGNGLSFGVTGRPEVAVEIKTSITAEDIFLAKDYSYGVMVPATVNADNFEGLVAGSKLYEKDSSDIFTQATSSSYDGLKDYYLLTDETGMVSDNYFPVEYDLRGSTTAAAATAQEIAKKIAQVVKSGANATTTNGIYKTTYNNISEVKNANTDLENANTDLGAGLALGEEILTWKWDFDGSGVGTNDAKDTILGDMIAARHAATTDYYVVAINSTNVVKTVKYGTADDYTAIIDTNTVVANLNTQFNIELTVTQVD